MTVWCNGLTMQNKSLMRWFIGLMQRFIDLMRQIKDLKRQMDWWIMSHIWLHCYQCKIFSHCTDSGSPKKNRVFRLLDESIDGTHTHSYTPTQHTQTHQHTLTYRITHSYTHTVKENYKTKTKRTTKYKNENTEIEKGEVSHEIWNQVTNSQPKPKPPHLPHSLNDPSVELNLFKIGWDRMAVWKRKYFYDKYIPAHYRSRE